MTVISESVSTITGADAKTMFVFSTNIVRVDGHLLTPVRKSFVPSPAGLLTTTSLEPGEAIVWIGSRGGFVINIPDSPTSILLSPLIAENLPAPDVEEALAVKNFGGATSIKVMTAAQYATLTASTTPNPGSIFLVY